jgi:hypothetical protein
MIWTALKSIIFSGIFICIIHYIITFFIETMTVPKVKDLITMSAKQQDLLNSLKRAQPQSNNSSNPSVNTLKNFLKQDPVHTNAMSTPLENIPMPASNNSSTLISFSEYE